MTTFEQWLESVRRMKRFRPEESLPDALVCHSSSARWLDPAMTGNPSRIGLLLDVPSRTMEFFVQEMPPGTAGDLQRHRHESVHYVTAGEGYSEIGPRTVRWASGDLIYTPPWVWHRHYNDGPDTVRMLLVESSRLLEPLGLNERESAGEITYGDFMRGEHPR
jgi:quercetin dioxygenase-like cupin family protein